MDLDRSGRFDWFFAAVASVCLLKKQMGKAGGFRTRYPPACCGSYQRRLIFGPGIRGLYQLLPQSPARRASSIEFFSVLLFGFAVLVPISILGSNGGSHGDFVRNAREARTTRR